MAVVDDSKPRRERSKDPEREGLEILAKLTTGRKHDYPACAAVTTFTSSARRISLMGLAPRSG